MTLAEPSPAPVAAPPLSSQDRRRIATALAELVAERGYDELSSSELVARSEVDPAAYSGAYSGKDECFLAIYEEAIDEAFRRMAAATAGVSDWEQQVGAGLQAFLAYVAENPTMTRMCLVDTIFAGPAPRTRYEQTIERFLPLLSRGRSEVPHGSQLPQTLEEMLAGGIFWRIHGLVVNREAEHIAEMASELSEFVISAYLGTETSC